MMQFLVYRNLEPITPFPEPPTQMDNELGSPFPRINYLFCHKKKRDVRK